MDGERAGVWGCGGKRILVLKLFRNFVRKLESDGGGREQGIQSASERAGWG